MLESKEIVWLECDGCGEEYGSLSDTYMDGIYEDENRLVEDAERDGWEHDPVSTDWFCEECSIKGGLKNNELTGAQEAALMHGLKVVL